MKKAPNPKFFIVLTAMTVIAGVALCFNQYSALQSTEQRVEALKKNALDQGELENNLKTSLTKLQQCSASLNHLEKGVPELDYVPTMLKELEGVGTQCGLQVLGVRPVPKVESPAAKGIEETKTKKAKKSYTELDIEVTCRGDYHAVKNFVQALQSFPKIVEARTVSLSPKQQDKSVGAPKLDTTITLRSFLFPPDKSELNKASQDALNQTQEAVKNVS